MADSAIGHRDGCRDHPALGANVLVSQSFPILIAKFDPGPVFLGYAVMGVLALVFVRSRVQETKGRSLEEIEADLAGDTMAEPA